MTVVNKPVIYVVDDDQDERRMVALDLNNRYAQRYRVLRLPPVVMLLRLCGSYATKVSQ